MLETSPSLLEALKREDALAWQRFQKVYEDFLRRQLFALLRNQADVDEVYQEVLIVLAYRITAFDRQGTGSFRSFLRKTCRYKCLERLRRDRRGQRGWETDGSPPVDFAQQPDPKDDFAQQWDHEYREFVQQTVLVELGRRCGAQAVEIYRLLQRKEHSREEIAALFQISPAKLHRVQAEVNRALREVKWELGDLLDL